MNTEQLESILTESCTEVLETMCFASVIDGEQDEEVATAKPIYSQLSFKGVLSGHFGICTSIATSCSLAAAFLGLDEQSVSQTQSEQVLCELANMICGAVLSRMDREATFDLSHPEIMSRTATNTERGTVAKDLYLDSGSVALRLTISNN